MNSLLISQLFGLLFYYGNCVIVDTRQGKLKGGTDQSRGGRSFYTFYGIPYAEPPVGDLRYQNPVPPKPWNGLRDATVLPLPCLSLQDEGVMDGQEDCLYLNLYTPKLTTDSPLPVMVFIYGGRLMYGHALPSRYGAHYFMDNDVIIITFHYRLGVLGFLSTEDDVIPGNYGLKDAVAVLQWVQNYVDSFGGDKKRVTVFGGSSGAVIAGAMLISPIAKGLFHRVISQSGTIIDPSQVGEASRGAWKMASLVGCDNSDKSESLLSCLRKLPAEELVKNNFALYTFGRMAPSYPWSPVIESEHLPGAFLVDDPRKLYQRQSNIPWIIGMNSGDGAMYAIYAYFNPIIKVIDEMERNYQRYFPSTSCYADRFTKDPEKLNEITEILKNHYFGDSEIKENAQAFAKTELYYLLSINETVSLYNGPLYVYYYDHRNNQTFAHVYGDFEEEMGVVHGDELISMYNCSEIITPVTEGIDLVVSQQVLELWTNFAAKGNPNGDGEVIWKPVKKPKIDYLHIKNGVLKPGDQLLKEELEFLQSIKNDFS